MSGNSQPSTGTAVAGYAQTLAAVLGGASTAYLDSQNAGQFGVTEPVPGTAYGPMGYSQPTPVNASSISSLVGSSGALMIVGLVVVAVFLLRR
jgi:hypothetical protein